MNKSEEMANERPNELISTLMAKNVRGMNAEQAKNMSDELEKMYTLAKNGKVHTESRQRSIRSHVRDVFDHFKTFSYEEFYNYVFHNYMEAVLKGKKLSRNYLLSKVNTIKRLSKTRFFGRRDIARIVGNLDKMINPMARTSTFYTNRGEQIELDANVMGNLRDLNNSRLSYYAPFKHEQPDPNAPVVEVSQLYRDSECEFLLDYFRRHLDNFLSSGIPNPSVNDVLALVITFMSFSPRRVNEILNLTLTQWDDLINRQITVVQSKSNLRPTNLLIPTTLANYLQSYLEVTTTMGERETLESSTASSTAKLTIVKDDRRHLQSTPVIKHKYQELLKTLKNVTASLLNRRVERPFHGFRNYFAGKYKNVDYQNTKRALDHASSRITNMYAHKQKHQYANTETLDFLNKCTQMK